MESSTFQRIARATLLALAVTVLARAGENKPMKLPTPFSVDGKPVMGTYVASSMEELKLVKTVGMNVILGGHDDLDPNSPRGKFCSENGVRVMHHMTQHIYGKPRLAGAITAEADSIPLLGKAGKNIPQEGRIIIEDEVIEYSGRSRKALTGCRRGCDGTRPAEHREGIILFWPDACAEEVRQVKDLPNLWGYYVLDDSPGDALSALRAMYRTIRRVEGDKVRHPVCAGYGSAGSLCNFGPDVCDIMMFYWYPVGNGGYERLMTSHQVQWMLTAARERVPGVPFIGVYQAFNGGSRREAVPTADQLREQVEDFVRDGCCGLVAFLCRAEKPLSGWAAHPHLQDALIEVHAEIRDTGALAVRPETEEMARIRIQPVGHWDRPKTVPGLVPAWHVVAPFDDEQKQRLEAEFPPDNGIDLSAVYSGKTGNIRWHKRLSHGGVVGLGELFGAHTEDVVAYATCTVTSPKPQRAQMRIGSDDDALVRLNGKEVWRHSGTRGLDRDNNIVQVDLPAGESGILVKVCNRAGMWGFFVRFTDMEGKPLDGLRFSPKSWIP